MKYENIVINNSSLKPGEIYLSGYKHAMVQIIAASIATNTPVTITNIPLVEDTYILSEIINESGGKCILTDHILRCDPTLMNSSSISSYLSQKIHGSIYLMPAFIVRFGHFKTGKTGGCQIGSSKENKERPFQHMLQIMEKFNVYHSLANDTISGEIAKITIDELEIDIKDFSGDKKNLTGSFISGATKTAILMSPLIKSLNLKNPYMKTDVKDLLKFFNLIGIETHFKHNELTISSITPKLKKQQVTFCLSECVSQIMTYIALAVCCDINLSIYLNNIESIKEGLHEEFSILDKMGIKYNFQDNFLNILKTDNIQAVDIDVTNNSIQSDHLPFFVLILLKANNASRVREFVWPERFAYVDELKKLGANLTLNDNTLLIEPSSLSCSQAELYGFDTRATAVVILAALIAKGNIIIKNISHLFRGYEGFIENLIKMGADIKNFSSTEIATL